VKFLFSSRVFFVRGVLLHLKCWRPRLYAYSDRFISLLDVW